MMTVKPSKAFKTFESSLKNDFTRKNYLIFFDQYLKWTEAKSANVLIKQKPKQIEDKLTQYISYLEGQGFTATTISAKLSAVRRFYDQNRLTLNWKWINSYLPKNSNGKAKDRDYSKEELSKLLDACNLRQKAILLILMSGMRIGGIASHYRDPKTGKRIITGLRLRNLQKITSYKDDDGKEQPLEGHIYKLTIYEGEAEEYYTFTTFEAARAIDVYLDFRKREGEELTPDSWLFRQEFADENVDSPKPVTREGLQKMFATLMCNVGIRTLGEKHERKSVMLLHGIRKSVNSRMVERGVNYVAKEFMIGHSTGLEKHYLRSQENNFLREWLKVIPAVTISNEKALQQQVAKLEMDLKDVDMMKRAHIDMKIELSEKDKHMKEMEERHKQDMQKMREEFQKDLEKEKEERQRFYEDLHARGYLKKREETSDSYNQQF